jgi:hypothetical protein
VWGIVNIAAIWWLLTYMRIGGQYWSSTSEITKLQWSERLIVALKSVGAHTALAIRPFPLSFGYPFNPSATFDSNLMIGVFTLSVIVVALFIFKRDRIIIFASVFIFFPLRRFYSSREV